MKKSLGGKRAGIALMSTFVAHRKEARVGGRNASSASYAYDKKWVLDTVKDNVYDALAICISIDTSRLKVERDRAAKKERARIEKGERRIDTLFRPANRR